MLMFMNRLLFVFGLMMFAIGCAGGGNKEDDGKLRETSAPYKVGDIYFENGVLGVVFDVTSDGMHGKIVSVDEAQMQWCDASVEIYDTYARDDYDGQFNTKTIMALQNADMYYAASWCVAHGQGWYLPAIDEVVTICKNMPYINPTLSKYGYNEIQNFANYWSSTERSEKYRDDYAAGVTMYCRAISGYDKSFHVNFVRAAYAF